jgi:hypothetical protein
MYCTTGSVPAELFGIEVRANLKTVQIVCIVFFYVVGRDIVQCTVHSAQWSAWKVDLNYFSLDVDDADSDH